MWDKSVHTSFSTTKGNSSSPTMFAFDNHWQENWNVNVADGNNDKSEHAISQPITMVHRRAEHGPAQPQSLTSPPSADGAVGFHMVEYVLASSPGGHELEARMKAMQINGNVVSHQFINYIYKCDK